MDRESEQVELLLCFTDSQREYKLYSHIIFRKHEQFMYIRTAIHKANGPHSLECTQSAEME
jgi:hypothetical protein